MPALGYFCSMNLFRIVVELFGLYLLYKLIFDVVIPFVGAYRQAKKQVGAMRDAAHQSHTETQQPPHREQASKKEPPVGEYIDFEEIK
jgi:hypothetical protein